MFLMFRATHVAAVVRLQECINTSIDNTSTAMDMYIKLLEKHDKLVSEVTRRGLRDEKAAAPVAEPDRPLAPAIAQALGQWPEGSAPYVANLQYAHAQLAIRGDDAADEIAAEIKQGEDVEMFT